MKTNNNNIPKEKALNILNNIHSATGLGMTFIALSHFNYPESGKESNVYATSAFALKRSRSSKEDLENRLNILQFSDLIIFYIKRHLVKEAPYIDLDIASYNKTSSLKVVVIDYDYFFSKEYLKHLDILSNNDRGPCVQIVLITESLNWSLIKTGLKKHNINLNSGNNTLKRVLSPNQFLLSKVIMLIYGFNTTLVERSFRYLARNKAFSGSLFDYTDKNNQIFIDSFPYGDSSCTSTSEANNGSNNNNNNSQSTNNNSVSSNNTTSDIKKETLGVSCRSNNSPAKVHKRGLHSSSLPVNYNNNNSSSIYYINIFDNITFILLIQLKDLLVDIITIKNTNYFINKDDILIIYKNLFALATHICHTLNIICWNLRNDNKDTYVHLLYLYGIYLICENIHATAYLIFNKLDIEIRSKSKPRVNNNNYTPFLDWSNLNMNTFTPYKASFKNKGWRCGK